MNFINVKAKFSGMFYIIIIESKRQFNMLDLQIWGGDQFLCWSWGKNEPK